MNLLTIPCGPLATNTYILWNDGSTEAVVVDPANSHRALNALHEHGLHCCAILITHCHFDHTMGAAELKKRESARLYINRIEAPSLTDGSMSLSHMGGVLINGCKADVLLDDGDRFSEAGFDFLVLHTPGHSPGSSCFVLEKERIIFAGDTIFRLSVGRTDLDGGDARALYGSIVRKLFTLEGDYRVLPGHDRETTLEFERRHNPFIRNGGVEF